MTIVMIHTTQMLTSKTTLEKYAISERSKERLKKLLDNMVSEGEAFKDTEEERHDEQI